MEPCGGELLCGSMGTRDKTFGGCMLGFLDGTISGIVDGDSVIGASLSVSNRGAVVCNDGAAVGGSSNDVIGAVVGVVFGKAPGGKLAISLGFVDGAATGSKLESPG